MKEESISLGNLIKAINDLVVSTDGASRKIAITYIDSNYTYTWKENSTVPERRLN